MLHKTKESLAKNISNSSCISPPQNACKISNISSWQLDALTYAKCWKTNIRHSLKQLLNSSILCQLWKKLIYIVKLQPTWDSREAGAKLRFSGSLRRQKSKATARGKRWQQHSHNEGWWPCVVKGVFSRAPSLLCQLRSWKWLHSEMSDPVRTGVLIFRTLLSFPSSNYQKLRDASQSNHFLLSL